MNRQRTTLIATRATLFCVAVTAAPFAPAELPSPQRIPQSPAVAQPKEQTPGALDAQREFKAGADLTRRGRLQQAISHLVAAERGGIDPYAVGLDLGICYVGTGQYKEAITDLQILQVTGSRAATVDNLLAQAYLGNGQPKEAFRVFLQAAAVAPRDETLYAFMADACTDHQDYSLGLEIVDRGLQQLPDSARLHYERALFLGRLGRIDEGKPEFDRAAQLAPGSYIGYLARVQEDLYDDDLAAADKVLRQAIQAGHRDYRMLSLLGTVLLHEGAAPGQPQFAEAKAALQESARLRPDFSTTQIALGKIYLMQGRPREAVDHLEIGRRLEPENPSVYANLANAYEQLGESEKAREMRTQTGRLLAERKTDAGPTQP